MWVRSKGLKYAAHQSAKCNSLFRTLEQNRLTRMLWSQMKPFVRGKIIYSPNSKAAFKIITRENETFSPLVNAVELSNQWLDTWSVKISEVLSKSHEQLAIIEPGNLPFQDLLEELLSNVTVTGKTNETLLIVIETMNEIAKEILSNSTAWLNKINSMIEEVRDYLECFELNRFVALNTEKDIVMTELDLIKDNKLWAGVVFNDIENRDQLPHFIQYKIRMASSKVDSTKRDGFHTPGPRRRPGIDMKYITFGFAYLQDMIEHAIIREQTGRTQETGIYLQQFSHPCYIFDHLEK
ncbi:phospholipid-transporting ATPase ABCA1 [Parasteatoda tepidariorum]|uniref:phospholipid-transporting ATPase ABCA1 n=1 Tax=Parasteatoda tepidariorum TaxID=114398 RepID=UPI001C726359|nr:phospholipid-transporting ATPase ABCA1 [Parasteatoda tepidariorum]XP_042909743.1 phospholipid-transporting ATPase ABCA1 [Parasteatoda tepidariorum]